MASAEQVAAAAEADDIEADVDAVIALCADERAAVRSLLVANAFLEAEVERLHGLISRGYARVFMGGNDPKPLPKP